MTPVRQISRLSLKNFKGFDSFQCHFREASYLLGPNSAGKSTIIAALRTGASLLAYAKQRKPTEMRTHHGVGYYAFGFSSEDHGFVDQNISHELRPTEASFTIFFQDGSRLTAVWPPRELEDASPFFYLIDSEGAQPRTPAAVRNAYPTVRVVPPLSPISLDETMLSAEHVRANAQTRLASSHFRNQLRLLREGGWPHATETYEAMIRELSKWTPEVELTKLSEKLSGDKVFLDAFCTEQGSPREREISWLGDGIQIWLQVLFHLHLNRSADAIILDEPDLYLHADLQRRLVRRLASLACQTIVATHSAEVIGEADSETLAWVDRSNRTSRSLAKSGVALSLSRDLGTGFNLGLARALRTQAALFVEGQDMKLLRSLGGVLGFDAIEADTALAVIPMRGRDNRHHVAPFTYLASNFLESSVTVFVLLDRDYWSDGEIEEIEDSYRDEGIECHVWRRKEIENYLLEPSALARIVSLGIDEVRHRLDEATEGTRADVLSHQLSGEIHRRSGRRASDSTVAARVVADFELSWRDRTYRLARAPGKEVLASFNAGLQRDDLKAVSFRQIARGIRPDEIDPEVLSVLHRINALIDSTDLT